MAFIDDLDMINVHYHTKSGDLNPNGCKDMDFFLVNYYLVTFGRVTDGQTESDT